MSEPPSPFLFETARLRVRAVVAADLDRLHDVYGDAETMRYVADGRPLDRPTCARWIEIIGQSFAARGYGMCALAPRRALGAVEVVGFCGIVHPNGQPDGEIKYAIAAPYRGLGLATEAVRGMLTHAERRLGLREVIATIDPGNLRSRNVLEKAGMRLVESRLEADGPTDVFAWRAPTPP